jgi:gluconolactonase
MTSTMGDAFELHDPRFSTIVGSSPTLELLAENQSYPFAHEAGVYFPDTNNLYITSNRCIDSDGNPKVHITRVDLNTSPVTCEVITPAIPMGNGGVNYGKDHVIFCAQGTMTEPSGLYRMSTEPPYKTEILKTDFLGRPFNSVNDVVVHSDGSVWFTDPIYGFEQGYRPTPRLPCQVYRWCPDTGSIRAVADGFGRPNGICFSPDEKTVYITDTDRVHGDGTVDDQRVSSM